MTAGRALLAPAGLLVALALVGCGTDQGPGGAAGDPVEASSTADLSGTDGFIQLPNGRLNFSLTQPGEFAADQFADPDQHRSALKYVGIAWDFVPGEGVPNDVSGFVLADDVPAEVSLRVDGSGVDLGPAYPVPGGEAPAGSLLVPVEDGVGLDEVEVALAFDGVEQSISVEDGVRIAGPAAALYEDASGPTELACAVRVGPTPVRADATCVAAAVALPWSTDVGWAADETTWWVVDVATSVTDLRDPQGGRYGAAAMSDTSTVDGAPPEAVLLDEFSASRAELRTVQIFGGTVDVAPTVAISRSVQVTAQREGALKTGDTAELSGTASPR